jgi:hypothetical protein
LNVKQTNKSQRGRKREERNGEKQAGNTKEIKEGKRKAKGSRTNKVRACEQIKGTQSRRKQLDQQRKSRKNNVIEKKKVAKNTKEQNDKK